jgi:hypothetical protein
MFHCIIQCVPLATEPSISLIILTPMKILQQNLNWGTFVVWEMKRNVSVVRLIVVTQSSGLRNAGFGSEWDTLLLFVSWTQWPHSLNHGYTAACLLAGIVGSNLAGAWTSALVSVVFCWEEVSGWSLIQRSPTECGVSNEFDHEAR